MRLNCPDWETSFPAAGLSVWRLRLSDLGDDPLETLRPLTVPAEHDRARRYRFDADRHRHLAGRGLIRALLAHQHDCDPRSVSIVEGPHGKPRVERPLNDGSAPEFNIAHTSDVVVVALSHTHPVGVDVEPQRRGGNVDGLAEHVLTEAEWQRWRTLPEADRSDFFFHVWTCKEAFLKATGTGLQRAPHTIECRFDGGTVVGLDDADDYRPSDSTASAAQWSPRPFQASEGIAGAVVRPNGDPSLLVFNDAHPLVNALSHA